MSVRHHKKFSRKNDDLHYDIKISMKEALLGFRR
jgi:DnaJ-class molecular chaperone